MAGISQDLRLAYRLLSARPLLTSVVVASLALGIGGATAMFSVVDHVLLRPLPFPAGQRAVFIEEVDRGQSTGGAPARLLDVARLTHVFEAVGGWYGESGVVTGFDQPFRIEVHRTFLGYPRLLGTVPIAGRRLTPDEESGKRGRVAMIGEKLWRERFQADPSVAGRTIHVGRALHLIAGVLPASASVNPDLQLWSPEPQGPGRFPRTARFAAFMGLLKHGVSRDTAQRELSVFARTLARQYPVSDRGLGFNVRPLLDRYVEDARQPLLVLLGAVGFMLLIACLNVSGLLLSRAAGRRKEIGIRAALGASRGSLVRLLLAECVLLCAAGGSMGLILSSWCIDVLRSADFVDVPRLHSSVLDWRVALFGLCLTALASLVCGIVPAWLYSRADIAKGLRSAGDRGTASARTHGLRDALVVAEVALSLALLTGTTLMLKSLSGLGGTPIAARPHQLLTMDLSLPWNSSDQRVRDFFGQVLAELRNLPGVDGVGFTNALPYGGAFSSSEAVISGPAGNDVPRGKEVLFHTVSSGYLETMGVRLLKGRWLTDNDRENRPRVALINQTAAKQLFGQRPPLGERIAWGRKAGDKIEAGESYEIVGIVSDLPRELGTNPYKPEVFQPFRQSYWPMATFVLRSRSGSAALVQAAREAVERVDPQQVAERFQTLGERMDRALAQPKYVAGLFGSFAGAALLLAALGVYGVVSQRVADRRVEAGIRGALGASPGQVLGWIMSRGWILIAWGLALGLGSSAVLMGLLDSLLYGLDPFDRVSWAGAVLLLAAAAASANLLGGKRILKSDPAQVLRAE